MPVATGVTTASFTDTGLTNGATYYYKVAALNSLGTSSQSIEASARTAAPIAAAPNGLIAGTSKGQATLYWNPSVGATSYNVYRGTASGDELAIPIATGVTTENYVNTGLTNGTPYFYKVAAVNAGGVSTLSNEASAKPEVPAP